MQWEYKTVTVENYEYVFDVGNGVHDDWRSKDLNSGIDGL